MDMPEEIKELRTLILETNKSLSAEIRTLGVQIEDTNRNVAAIIELVVPMHRDVQEIKKTLEDIPVIKDDIATIKFAVKQTNNQLKDHERRITKLESHAA
jgi:phosphoenolpyruvate carboxylase